MMFKHTDNGKVKIRIYKYLEEVLDELSYDNQVLSKAALAPAANNLFMVKETTRNIWHRRKEVFHSMVAQLLFLSIRMQPNIPMTVRFLCTRVKETDKDNWK